MTSTLEEVLQAAIDSKTAAACFALPGRVVSYNASTQTADIRPMIKGVVFAQDEEAEDAFETLPVIPSVRILHLGGKGFYLHFPLEAGDTVLLICLDRDPTQWLRTGELSPPPDVRTHSLANAVAIPGLRPTPALLGDISSTYPTVGFEGGLQVTIKSGTIEVGGDSDAAALASKVNELADFVYNHTHPLQHPAHGSGPQTMMSTTVGSPAGAGPSQSADAVPIPGSFLRPIWNKSDSAKLKVED